MNVVVTCTCTVWMASSDMISLAGLISTSPLLNATKSTSINLKKSLQRTQDGHYWMEIDEGQNEDGINCYFPNFNKIKLDKKI